MCVGRLHRNFRRSTMESKDLAEYEQVANDVYVYGSVALALAMARETKMIHSLCTAGDPLTSTQIASQLNLKERYVREVLNSLTVAGLVQLEAGTGGKEGQEARYWVPPTCRQTLECFSTYTRAISASAREFSTLKKCFDLEGPRGFFYGPDSFDAMKDIGSVIVDPVVEAILETPGLKERLEKGLSALEVGCGTGWLFLRFAAMFPNSHFTLTDPKTDPLERARKQAEEKGLTNVTFQPLDIFKMPDDFKERFDWVSSVEVIHDLPFPARGLEEVAKMLKPGGHYSLVDQFVSSYVRENLKCKDSAALYAFSSFMCIPESYQDPNSDALGACWGTEKASELIKAAGMNILRFTDKESLGTLQVCMCQKPEVSKA